MPGERSSPRPRGAPVVEAIFAATFAEIDRVGYGGLSREEVAVRAGVNTSTVYRRWPTTLELVSAAVDSERDSLFPHQPDSGALRDDLVAFILTLAKQMRTPSGRAVMRMFLFDRKNPELEEISRRLTEDELARGPQLIFDRAIARGELPVGTPRGFLIDTVRGAVLARALLSEAPIDTSYAQMLVDTLLDGALSAKPARSRTKA